MSDWSFANIFSICRGFNNVTLFHYLRIVYKSLTRNEGKEVLSNSNNNSKSNTLQENSVTVSNDMDNRHVEEIRKKRKQSTFTYFTNASRTLENIKFEDNSDTIQSPMQKSYEGDFKNTCNVSEYPDKRALENGLFYDVDYYLSCTKKDFILRIFKYEDTKIYLIIKEYNRFHSTLNRAAQVGTEGKGIRSVW